MGDPGLGFADSATILTSTDGVNWVQRESGLTGNNRLFGIAYGNRQFVAVGTSIVTSANGLDWVQRQLETQDYLSGIAYGNGQFVAVGDNMLVLTSTDGVDWVERPDGVDWVERRSGGERSLLGIAYGNGHFVAMGPGGRILESGSIITLAITPKAGTGLFTLSLEGPTGLGYTIQTSTDLISWRNLTNITSAQGTNIILDALPAASERLFYRAYSQ